MAIYARRNFIFTNFGPNVLLTQPLEAGQTLIYDPSKGSFVNEPGASSAITVVADIPSRDALIPNLIVGQMVFVQDAGNNEYALYMWDGSAFVTISTQNSAAADANTVNYQLDYNSPSTILLGSILPGHRAVNITVDVIVPFNGSLPTLSIGDDQNTPTSLMGTDQNDLTVVQNYMTEGKYVYTGTQGVNFSAYYVPNGSTQGQAMIIVSYV